MLSLKCSPTFKDQCESFYAVKVKKGVETKVPSTFIGLSPSLQNAVFSVVSQLTPTHGPWDQVKLLLRHCDETFNNSTSSVKQAGMPANRITCVSHMLTDERVIPLLVKQQKPMVQVKYQ
jgi:hypothetical protein